MTPVSLQFGNSRELKVTIDEPVSLMQGAGVHRLLFPLEVDPRNTIKAGVPVVLGGDAWFDSGHLRWLGRWTTEHPVITRDGHDYVHVVVALTDEQLAVIERLRAGGDVRFKFNVDAVLGYDPDVAGLSPDDRWPQRSGEVSVYVQSGPWARLLEQVKAGTALAVVTPIALSNGLPAAVGEDLRDAIRKINAGDYAGAVTTARKAIDALAEAGVVRRLNGASLKAILDTKKDERSADDRLCLLTEALHAMASPSAHGDSNARAIGWNRDNALAVTAGVAALAACLMPE